MNCWGFEIFDMFRRFMVVGFPKLLRGIASANDSVQFYIGLLVMTIAPVLYGELDPYEEQSDKGLMIFTQLAHSIVMFCGVMYDTLGTDDLANVLVSLLSLVSLVPMFFVLILYIIDPRSAARLPL